MNAQEASAQEEILVRRGLHPSCRRTRHITKDTAEADHDEAAEVEAAEQHDAAGGAGNHDAQELEPPVQADVDMYSAASFTKSEDEESQGQTSGANTRKKRGRPSASTIPPARGRAQVPRARGGGRTSARGQPSRRSQRPHRSRGATGTEAAAPRGGRGTRGRAGRKTRPKRELKRLYSDKVRDVLSTMAPHCMICPKVVMCYDLPCILACLDGSIM